MRVMGRLLPLPGVAGHLGAGHSDRQAPSLEDVSACPDHPRVSTTRATAIMTAWMSPAVTLLSAAAPALARSEAGGASTAIRAAILTGMNSRGARELCSTEAAVRSASVYQGRGFRQSRILPRVTAERAAAGLAGYTSTTSLLLTGGITPDG
jgi:hypothetical protein